ncbi:ISAs1 family transposase [Micromonospora sp. ALFpr18c]|uniref:ISAs1 family transposase n=1 Tax=Micromonospora sp. ALFpr18c TaxID=1458665 RepID=UPI00124AE6E6|nr:ISAs1 family transposase [Micromonospora sp. ALFpr18c]KAB1927202.1 ISAs1 family transposase [Micromonospora sp. ALFpr18c]
MSVSSPISPVVDHLADLALWEAELADDPLVMASSLAGRLAGVPDPRKPQGRRHRLVVILALTACATLVVGNDCVTAIWQWAAGTDQEILARIGARYDAWTGRYLVPSEPTFRRVLAGVDGDALDSAVSGYIADVLAGQAPVPVLPAAHGPAEREQRRAVTRQATARVPAGLLPAAAIDGKLLRGSVTTGGRVFLVAAIDHSNGTILGQRQVADKRGENTALQPLLSGLDTTGMVFTLDALHTTKKTARLITEALNAHYILILKANQPLALQAAQALLSGTDTAFAGHTDTTDDRGHGRTEHRTLRVTDCDDRLFPGARQVFRLRRDTGGLDGIRTSKEIVYGIASLTAELAAPAHLNHYTRQHWCVENRLHWVRDVTFREDSSQLRTGNAPRNLAAFRNLALSTIRFAGRTNIAHTRRDLHDRTDAFAVYSI